MRKTSISKSAFSLIEISIVILIIGILVAGVTQGSRLVAKFKLATAKSLTQSSPVASIEGLAYWFESTSDSSFAPSEAVDGAKISNWYDISPNNMAHESVSQSNSDNQPVYKSSSELNGLPAVYFDANARYLTNTDYQYSRNVTMFAVVKTPFKKNIVVPGDSEWGNIFSLGMTGQCGFLVSNLASDFSTDVNQFQFWGVYWDATDIAYNRVSQNSAILSGVIDGSDLNSAKVKYSFYSDGSYNGEIEDYGCSNSFFNQHGNYSSEGITVGGDTYPDYYQGYIGELILFKRVLTDEERKSVEKYLSQKWNIPLTN